MLRVTRSRLQRYSVAILAVVLALLPMLLLEPLMPMQCSPLMLGFAAVIVSAWYGGLGPGLLAIALVIPAVDYFFISPIHSLISIDRADGVQLVVFSLVSLLNISLNAAPTAELSASDRLSKLCASEVKFRRLFDSNMIGVLFSDLEGNITEANDAFLKMVGYTQADLKAGEVRWDKMTPSEYRHLDDQAIAELKEGGVSAPWEKEYIRSDGNRVSVVLACALLEGSQKNCVSFVLDLTERQRREQELRELYQHLQDLNRSLEEQVTERTTQLREQIHQLNERTAELAAAKLQMQTVLNHIPAFIHIIGLDGRIKFANAKWRELPSQVGESFVGCHINEIFTAEETEKFLHQNQTVALANQVVSFENEILLPDGVHTFLDVKVPLVELTGEVHAICGIALDLTDRKQMETALRQSEQRLRAIVDNVPLGLYTTGRQGCEFVNQYWLSQAGLTLKEALGKGWMQVIHPLDWEWVVQKAIEAENASRSFEAEYRFVDQDGNIHWVLDRAVPIRDENEQFQFYQGFWIDITERKQAEELIRRSAAEVSQIFNMLPSFVWKFCPNTGQSIYASDIITELSGISKEAFLQNYQIWNERVDSGQESQATLNIAWEAISQGKPYRIVYLFHTLHRGSRWFESTGRPAEEAGVIYYYGSTTDITERKQAQEDLRTAHNELEMRVRERTAQLEQANLKLLSENTERQRAQEVAKQSEERYRTLVEQAADGIFIADLWGNFLEVNQSCCSMSGYSRQEILGRRVIDMMPSEDISALPQTLSDLQSGKTTMSEWRLKRKDGRVVLVEVSAKMLLNGQFQGIMRDITQRKQAEYELRHNAFHDPLTSLPNRAFFIDRLEHAIQQTKRHKDFVFAVLFLDLDRFKVINDSLGHLIGDQLLLAIAGRLEACLRLTDTAARLGGDEFTILLEGINDVSDALRVADRIQKELALPFALDGQEVFTTASIGIALSATGYDRPEDLLRDADTAMYRAKEMGKARYEIFNTQMHTQAVARLQLETDLRNAIERQEFRLQYQPIVSLSTGRIIGFEALVRWQHPQLGLQNPAEFITVAEETGLLNRISQWVFRIACLELRTWQLQLPATPPLTMSVNLSGQQFTQPHLINQIQQILQETGLDGSSLRLEITEGGIMESAASATATLWQFRQLGVQLSIDDFGTGYSSLGRLHHFPINGLKIDRSFVSQIGTEEGNSEIVDTIVTLAHKLGVDVTAEGVETQAQLALLRELKCEYGQGYFFSQPLDSEAAEALLMVNPHW